jgi:FkbM family methyltransferase
MINRLKRVVVAAAPGPAWLAFPLLLKASRRSVHQVEGVELRFGADCPLGSSGDRLSLPMDALITPAVVRDGAWEVALPQRIGAVLSGRPPHHLIDLGANCGLFTRQLLLRGVTVESVDCVEADPDNFRHLRKNLEFRPDARLHNVALGEEERQAAFYRDTSNHGNYSLLQASVPRANTDEVSVKMVAARDFFARLSMLLSGQIAIKCDIQGYDEFVLLQIPEGMWQRVDCVLVEISQIEKPAIDEGLLLSRLGGFEIHELPDGKPASAESLIEFSKGREGVHRDYLLTRPISA